MQCVVANWEAAFFFAHPGELGKLLWLPSCY